MENINETSLHGSLEDILNEPGIRSNHEFDECLETLNKPVEDRHPMEIEHMVSKIGSLGIFDRSLLENMDPKVVIKKLVPFFKYEFFPAGAPLFHYEQTADKMFIICRGKAREFDAKNLDTIEKESRAQYRADPLPRDMAISLQELPKTLTSLNILQEGEIQSLVIINEEDVKEIEKEIRSPTTAAKKFQKMKAFFPFLKKMIAQKTATQRINDYSYKQSLRKARSLQRSNDHSSLLSPGTLENELIDSAILEEFKKFPRAYFIGGILKVKFSRYLESGDYCGLRALQDNALRTKAVIADEDCHCISLDKDDFFSVLEEEKALHLDKINFFKKLFGKFDEKRVIKFALGWDEQVLKLGDTVFQQNEPSDCLYALFRGDVVLSKAAPTQKKAQIGQELPFRIKKRQDPTGSVKVATLCAGDFFGDADFFQGNLRQFTATVSSARAKVFQLPLKKYQETQRNYFDFYREIKTIMGLKLKWNKERFQQQNQTQNPALGRLSTLSPNFDKERVLKDIGHFFPASVNCIPNEEKPQILNNLNNESSLHNNSIQNEIKSWVCRDDRSTLGSPKSQSFFDFDNSSHQALLRVINGNENSSRTVNKLVNVSKDRSLDVSGQDSILLFSRAQLPKQYTPRHGDLSRKPKNTVLETVPDVFEPKRIKIKRKTEVTSKADNITRFSAIELLKKRAIKKKAQPVFMEMKAASQAIPSIEFDVKPQSPIFNETANLTTTNQTNFSPGEKTQTLPSSLRGQSVENQHRKTKPISKGKLSRLLLETSDSSEPKRQFNSSGLCQNNSNHLANQKTVSNSTCFVTGLFQTGPRYSMKSSQPDISKSLNNIQMLSPKGEDSQKMKENSSSKGFRVTTSKMNHEFFKITMGKKRPGTGIKRAALM